MKKIIISMIAALLIAGCAFAPATARAKAEEAQRKEFLVDSCENSAVVREGELDVANYIEGGGCLRNSGTGPIFILNLTGFDRIAASIPLEEAYVEFYLWVDKPENLTGDSQFEFNDKGDYDDDDEISWTMHATNKLLKSGWNYVCLKFSEAFIGPNVQYADINYMRFYFGSPNGSTVRFDSLKIVDKPLELTADDIVGTGVGANIINYIVDPNVALHGAFPVGFTVAMSVTGGVILLGGIGTAVFLLLRNKKKGNKTQGEARE